MSTRAAANVQPREVLCDLLAWCHNNIAYFPETAEAQAIAARAEAALEKPAGT